MPEQKLHRVTALGCTKEQNQFLEVRAGFANQVFGMRTQIRLLNIDGLEGDWWMEPPLKASRGWAPARHPQVRNLALKIVEAKGDITYTQALEWVQDEAKVEEVFGFVKETVRKTMGFPPSSNTKGNGFNGELSVFLGERFSETHRWADIIIAGLFPDGTKFFVFTEGTKFRRWVPFDPLSETPLEVLELDTKTFNALGKAGIGSVRSLLDKDERTLMRVNMFGKSALSDVRTKLAARGWYLQGEEPEQEDSPTQTEQPERTAAGLEWSPQFDLEGLDLDTPADLQ
jgi:hypothetical protein